MIMYGNVGSRHKDVDDNNNTNNNNYNHNNNNDNVRKCWI